MYRNNIAANNNVFKWCHRVTYTCYVANNNVFVTKYIKRVTYATYNPLFRRKKNKGVTGTNTINKEVNCQSSMFLLPKKHQVTKNEPKTPKHPIKSRTIYSLSMQNLNHNSRLRYINRK